MKHSKSLDAPSNQLPYERKNRMLIAAAFDATIVARRKSGQPDAALDTFVKMGKRDTEPLIITSKK